MIFYGYVFALLFAICVCAILAYLWVLGWSYTDRLERHDWFLTLLHLCVSAGAPLCVAWALGREGTALTIRLAAMIGALLMVICAIVIAWICSIKKYRTAGEEPYYAAFFVVCGYLFALAAGSFVLMF